MSKFTFGLPTLVRGVAFMATLFLSLTVLTAVTLVVLPFARSGAGARNLHRSWRLGVDLTGTVRQWAYPSKDA